MLTIHQYGQYAAHVDLIDSLSAYIALSIPEERIEKDIRAFRTFSKEEDEKGNESAAFMNSYIAQTLEDALEEHRQEEAAR